MSVTKAILVVIAAVPLLFIGQCMYASVAQPAELQKLCATAKGGTSVRQALAKFAGNESFKVRTGGPAGKKDGEWFDREYLRIGDYLRKSKNIPDDYTVIFAKPGVGYYACIIVHQADVVKDAWFDDRSS